MTVYSPKKLSVSLVFGFFSNDRELVLVMALLGGAVLGFTHGVQRQEPSQWCPHKACLLQFCVHGLSKVHLICL